MLHVLGPHASEVGDDLAVWGAFVATSLESALSIHMGLAVERSLQCVCKTQFMFIGSTVCPNKNTRDPPCGRGIYMYAHNACDL